MSRPVLLIVYRGVRFSPNSEERDIAILKAVAQQLSGSYDLVEFSEDRWDADAFMRQSKDCVLTMARSATVLASLRQAEQEGVRVINSPKGVEGCARSRVEAAMRRLGVPMAPAEGEDGYWLKRGDAAAQTAEDVVFAPDKASLADAIRKMEQRGVSDYTVSAHVSGDLVKFYGVRHTGFFRHYYPTDDGITKFGDEQHNGMARHYPFDEARLLMEAERLAGGVGVDVYGGDCIVRPDGSFCIIDFNDWPSFSRCREEAARAIASLVEG